MNGAQIDLWNRISCKFISYFSRPLPSHYSLSNKRLPNGSINFNAFNELAAIVSAFTFHMSNVTTSAPGNDEEFSHLINHILTCPLKDENGEDGVKIDLLPNNDFDFDLELFAALEKEASKIESYYDVP